MSAAGSGRALLLGWAVRVVLRVPRGVGDDCTAISLTPVSFMNGGKGSSLRRGFRATSKVRFVKQLDALPAQVCCQRYLSGQPVAAGRQLARSLGSVTQDR